MRKESLYRFHDDVHSHEVEIRFNNGDSVHDHRMTGATSYDLGHEHKYDTSTDMSANVTGHTHQYFGVTTVDAKHQHEMRGQTGPAIYNSNGSHYHEYIGETSTNGSRPHVHQYMGKTKSRK
ncbi:YmaF family protein [Haloplasma contractile]|uniref:YmaF family protein n=1 Tax=Haloplasma contractile SSD-17B TaxID=1033810 RepID=U2E9Z2_9MOLU|nr:YmaF family protein [Haloplasma contractile]ERJ11943.1 hypothetical protein HLPCO_001857 [Haloplasma contractile SSD-17B]